MSVYIIVSGLVQGIGFRKFIKSKAKKLNLKGWVKNTENGNVEILAEGLKDDIEKLILIAKKGPFLAKVKNVQVEYKELENEFTEFLILR